MDRVSYSPRWTECDEYHRLIWCYSQNMHITHQKDIYFFATQILFMKNSPKRAGLMLSTVEAYQAQLKIKIFTENFSLREIAWKWFDLQSRVIWGRLSGTMVISLLFAPLDPAPPSYNSQYLPLKKAKLSSYLIF